MSTVQKASRWGGNRHDRGSDRERNERIQKLLDWALESKTGESAQTFAEMSISEMRDHFDAKNKRKTVFTSKFPFIGRGNVLRDRLLSHEQVIRDFEEALKD